MEFIGGRANAREPSPKPTSRNRRRSPEEDRISPIRSKTPETTRYNNRLHEPPVDIPVPRIVRIKKEPDVDLMEQRMLEKKEKERMAREKERKKERERMMKDREKEREYNSVMPVRNRARREMSPNEAGSGGTGAALLYQASMVMDELKQTIDKKIAQEISFRLRNLLKLPKAHKWVCYEWFYSNIDK